MKRGGGKGVWWAAVYMFEGMQGQLEVENQTDRWMDGWMEWWVRMCFSTTGSFVSMDVYMYVCSCI